MRKIISIISDGSIEASEVLRLDHDMRNRRRMVFTTEQGSILLDMARPVHLRDGDVLALDDGNACRIEAMAEAVIEIHAHDLPALVRIAWHLGNRHLPTQLLGDRLRIRHDHVIADMVKGLGGHCDAIMAPFDPERGAYAEDQALPGAGHHHHHDHEHHHG